MSEELEKLRHKQYVAEKKLTAAKHKITDIGGMKIATYAVGAKASPKTFAPSARS